LPQAWVSGKRNILSVVAITPYTEVLFAMVGEQPFRILLD